MKYFQIAPQILLGMASFLAPGIRSSPLSNATTLAPIPPSFPSKPSPQYIANLTGSLCNSTLLPYPPRIQNITRSPTDNRLVAFNIYDAGFDVDTSQCIYNISDSFTNSGLLGNINQLNCIGGHYGYEVLAGASGTFFRIAHVVNIPASWAREIRAINGTKPTVAIHQTLYRLPSSSESGLTPAFLEPNPGFYRSIQCPEGEFIPAQEGWVGDDPI